MTKREKALVAAVATAKAGQFGLTAVKIELEARFNRRHARSSNFCDRCNNQGDECEDCGGSGVFECMNGHEEIMDDNGLSTGEYYDSCDDCEDGRYDCDGCDGLGGFPCDDCGSDYAESQPEVAEGEPNWRDMRYIHDVLLEKLAPLGLAELRPADMPSDYSHNWQAKSPLVFSKVYPDSTVDTEWTLTLLLNNRKNILLLPKIVEAFTALKDEIGQGIDVSNAGMHISLLNTAGGHYPSLPSDVQRRRFANFRRSMILLMPALFFLASSNDKSRSVGSYRKPNISETDKYCAVTYCSGALEFRVFETCYDNPEVVLDDVLVALNCLRYWTLKYTRNHLQKIANGVMFGIDNSYELKRLYVTSEHIDLLNRGLRLIKPSYYTVTEIKAQRNFKVTKKETNALVRTAHEKIEKEYKIYEKRFGWDLVMQRNNYIARYINSNIVSVSNPEAGLVDIPLPDDKEVLFKAEEYAAKRVKEREAEKATLKKYTDTRLPILTKSGDWRLLCAE